MIWLGPYPEGGRYTWTYVCVCIKDENNAHE